MGPRTPTYTTLSAQNLCEPLQRRSFQPALPGGHLIPEVGIAADAFPAVQQPEQQGRAARVEHRGLALHLADPRAAVHRGQFVDVAGAIDLHYRHRLPAPEPGPDALPLQGVDHALVVDFPDAAQLPAPPPAIDRAGSRIYRAHGG